MVQEKNLNEYIHNGFYTMNAHSSRVIEQETLNIWIDDVNDLFGMHTSFVGQKNCL